jgi:Uma2 family endonuclease
MELLTDAVQIVASRKHLPLRVRPATPLTDDALFELCRVNRDLRIERTSEGDLIIMSPTGGRTGRRNFTLTTEFGIWVAGDGTGVGFDSSTGFVLPNGAERAPDVAWVRKARWDALTSDQQERFVPLCPDFVIELRSPSDDLEDLHAKMREYIENGAALGWLLDPLEPRAWVYRPGAAPERLDAPATISGDPVLPGFVLDLTNIW